MEYPAPFEPPTIRHRTAFGLFLGHLDDRDRLVELLEAQRDWATELLDDLAAVQADIAADERFRYPTIVADWGLEFYGAERHATSNVISALDDIDS